MNAFIKGILFVGLGFVTVVVQASHEATQCTQIVPYTRPTMNLLKYPVPVRGEVELTVWHELFDDQKEPEGLELLLDSNPNTPRPNTPPSDFREYYESIDVENGRKEEQKTIEALSRELPPFANQLYYYDNFKEEYQKFFTELAQKQEDEIKQRDRKTMSELVVWNDRDKICSILRKYVPQKLCDVIVDYICSMQVIRPQ